MKNTFVANQSRAGREQGREGSQQWDVMRVTRTCDLSFYSLIKSHPGGLEALQLSGALEH